MRATTDASQEKAEAKMSTTNAVQKRMEFAIKTSHEQM
jgi:hypothetical protein